MSMKFHWDTWEQRLRHLCAFGDEGSAAATSVTSIALILAAESGLPVTRNMVSGKVHRLGIHLPFATGPRRPANEGARVMQTLRSRKASTKPSRTLASTGFVHGGTLPSSRHSDECTFTKVSRDRGPPTTASPVPAARRPEPQEKPLALLLMDLEDKQCRWPLDTESEGVRDRWLFCGLPRDTVDDPGCKYCRGHWKRSLSEEGLRREMAKRRKAA